jgi:SAM-dependent methyltransferase
MPAMSTSALEILSVELLDRHRDRVEELRALSRGIAVPIGWHYLLDLVWLVDRVGDVNGKRILDAGAGIGVIQWFLAGRGAEVLSVDRGDRARLPLHLRRRFAVRGLRAGDLAPPLTVGLSPRALARSIVGALRGGLARAQRGSVVLYRADLAQLADVPDSSIDAIVSVSALEHNTPERLPVVVEELLRVLRPGGLLLATLGGAKDRDWFHEPSSGWCYTEATLRRAFHLPETVWSNYDRYDEHFAALRDNRELREGLAAFYYRSGKNGMPWGRWDPLYQTVGVCKVKE